MLKTVQIALFSVLFIFSANSVLAHAKVNTTSPVNGEVLTEAPETIYMRFVKKAKLTKVTLQLNQQEPVELDLSKHKRFKKRFYLSSPTTGKGVYKVRWKGLARDDHGIEGTFMFTVK